LHYCAENTTADGAQLLVKANPALVNQPDEEGYTPLHLAVIAGNRTMLRYLLDHGAEVNLLDNERHSVVHWATVCGELESLDVVLDAGAEASVEDIHGAYPIHYAAQMCGNNKKTMGSGDGSGQGGGGGPASSQRYTGLAALKKLINHGVPVDVIDRDGRQPLLWAASSGIITLRYFFSRATAIIERNFRCKVNFSTVSLHFNNLLLLYCKPISFLFFPIKKNKKFGSTLC
jgi:ankyrin repeat protein